VDKPTDAICSQTLTAEVEWRDRFADPGSFMLVLLAALALGAPDYPPVRSAEWLAPPACAAAFEGPVCVEDVAPTAEEARRALGDRATAWRAEGDRLRVFAWREGETVSLCCAARVPMRRVGDTDLWSVTLRVKDLDRAVLDILVGRDPANADLPQYRGPNAPAAPVFAAGLQGKLLEEAWDSAAAGEQRKLSVYTPPGFDPARRYPVVYLADGYVLEGYARLVEPLILSGDLPPVVMAGLWPNQGDPAVNWRRLDWQVGVDPERFARIEKVLLTEAMPLVEAKYGASSRPRDRLIYGTSAGAAWSAVMAARHPDVFGHAAAFSLGWGPAADAAWRTGPRLYLAAGTLEPEYLRVTSELAARARAAGREVRLDTPVAGHSFTTWQPRMIEAIRWAFGAPKKK